MFAKIITWLKSIWTAELPQGGLVPVKVAVVDVKPLVKKGDTKTGKFYPQLLAKTKMVCPNCGDNHWENVDKYRLKAKGMYICSGCGFVSYPEKWQSYEEIKKHYRKAYRNPPTSQNFFTGQRKLYFHQGFLQPLFQEWADKKFDNPNVFEIGAAYGMVLDWFKQIYPKCKVAGTELTTSFKRVCKHEFGIDLQDDFDESQKYDLIISYKVAEHQLDVNKELRKYAISLSENGHLYVSVPTWFDSANNFGLGGFDLEYYYDPNHINMWTRPMWENMLARAGLEIVKKDYLIYDSTYLCKRNDALLMTPVLKESVADIKDRMDRIKKAFDLVNESRFDEAIEVYPDYPNAHIIRAENVRQKITKSTFEWVKENIIDFALKSCPTSVDIVVMAADIAMRAEQYPAAIKYAEYGLSIKPENTASLSQLVHIMREMALRATNDVAKQHYFKEARNIARHLRQVSMQHFRESVDLIYTFNAELPIESEKQDEQRKDTRPISNGTGESEIGNEKSKPDNAVL